MKKTLSEFKAFALRGNVIDLAVAVVIGGAFGKIVSALVSDLIMPFAGWIQSVIVGSASDWREMTIPGDPEAKLKFPIGHLLGEIVDFTIVAFVIFIVIIKVMGRFKKREESGPPTTKTCPECLEAIAIKARKCKFCASAQPDAT